MNDQQKVRYETLQRIKWFLDKNEGTLTAVRDSQARAQLFALIVELEQLAGFQRQAPGAVKSRAKQKKDLREALREEHMQPISAIARASLADSPLIVKMDLPPKTLDDAALIAAGTGMIEAAAQYRNVFLAQRMGDDFLDRLAAAVRALAESVREREGTRVQRRQAFRAVQHKLTQASTLVRIVDGLVLRAVRTDPVLRSGWETAKASRSRPTGRGTDGVAEQPVIEPAA